jgi:hypothetical protein
MLTFVSLKTLPGDQIRHKKTGTDNSVAGFTIRSLLSLVTNSDMQLLASTCSSYLKDAHVVKPPRPGAKFANFETRM